MNGPNITGKQRASRIPLDYYKHGDAMSRRKAFWTRLALGVTLAWCLLLVPACMMTKSSPVAMERFSHGQVCRAHVAIGHECSACHVSFPMLGGRDAVGDVLAGARSTFKGDLKCLECHLGDTRSGKLDGYLAVHHATMKVDMTPNCGTCHQDHKGLDKDLRRVADAKCTDCHKDVNASMTADKSAYGNVTSFQSEHPAFRSTQGSDPGKLKFNHAYHMTPGIVLTQGGKAFTVADMTAAGDGVLAASVRSRAGNNASAPVKLDCADCHRPSQDNDRGWKGDAPVANVDNKDSIQKAFAERRQGRTWVEDVLSPPRTPGAYMQPIKYESHCATCHPTTFSPGLPPIQHDKHLQPPDLRKEVERIVASAGGQMPKPPAAFFPLPGKTPATGTVSTATQVEMAMRSLLEGKRTCGECHLDARGGDLSVHSEKIAPTSVPEVWLKHARFDHSAHAVRGITCRECHAQAYADSPKDVLDAYGKPHKGAEMVMLPGIDNCRQCHSPNPASAFAAKGLAAKHDCTECHNYHHGTPPKK